VKSDQSAEVLHYFGLGRTIGFQAAVSEIVSSDHVGAPYGCAIFGANPSTGGGLLGEWMKNNEFLFIYLLLFLK